MPRFKELRQAKHLTQEQLIEQFNAKYGKKYGPSSISMFENGKRIPETSALMDFADFFGVTVDYLLGRPDPMQQISRVQRPAASDLTNEEQAMLTAYRQANPTHKKLAVLMLKAGATLPVGFDESVDKLIIEKFPQKLSEEEDSQHSNK